MTDKMRRHTQVVLGVVLALAFASAPVYAQQLQPLNPPLKNWAAPLYWAPSPAEFEQQRIERRIAYPEVSSSAITQAMTFIAMTPCRVMDTRSSQPFTGAFGPPSLAAYVTRQVPMPSSSCNIPSNAGAYSLNVTVVPPGALSFLTVWPAGQSYPTVSTLNDPVSGGVIANAAIVPAGIAGAIQMVAGNPTDVIIDINGYYATPTDVNFNTALGAGALANNEGYYNTATGANALQNNTTGGSNTAIGQGALFSNTTGSDNTASGENALYSNTTGVANTATGQNALVSNTTGVSNTAVGTSSLQFNTSGNFNTAVGGALANNTTGGSNTAVGGGALAGNTTGNQNTAGGASALYANTTGNYNTASGLAALFSNTTGSNNTASGYWALLNNTTGSNNIAVGYEAAQYVPIFSSNNIHIGNLGAGGDNATIKIGTSGTQTSFFVAGVSGVPTGLASPVPVLIDANGQLGTMSSSARFKEDIQDMGDSSSGLMRLRPVTFRYKQPYTDGSKPIDYGLIAEEVADVYPDLVAYSPSGEVQTVQYQKVNAMLLNEVQKQHQQISTLEAQLAELEKRLEALAAPK